jgi:hypothetical protein
MTFTDHKGLWGQSWIALSNCGHYAIALDTLNPRGTRYRAKFIPGVFATAQNIGHLKRTRAEAEAVCEEHALTPDFTSCAKAV